MEIIKQIDTDKFTLPREWIVIFEVNNRLLVQDLAANNDCTTSLICIEDPSPRSQIIEALQNNALTDNINDIYCKLVDFQQKEIELYTDYNQPLI